MQGALVEKARNEIDGHVGGRVRMRRLMLDLSQQQLAEALGLTYQQVQKYEKGTNRISASRLQRLSHILQVPVSFFFEGAPRELHLPEPVEAGPEMPREFVDFLATSDGIALAMAFARISDSKVRRAVVALVEQLVSGPG